MDDRTIKNNILKRRKSLALTQSELADKLNVDRTTYRNIEKGDTKILGGHLDEIARALETTPEALVVGYDPQSPEDNPAFSDIMAEERKAAEKMRTRLEERIAALEAELRQKDARIEELERWLRDKEQLNDFLKVRLESLSGRENG